MSWASVYHLTLYLLPAALRRKHGTAMKALFARELGRACARGPLHGALAGAAGVWDVVRRGAYERVRPGRDAAGERGAPRSREAWRTDAHGPRPAATLGDPHVPPPTTRRLLRRLAIAFAVAFVALTTALLANYATRRVPTLSAHGMTASTIVEILLLSVPFTAAMTIPMAVFVAALYEFTRLRADGTLAAARRVRGGLRCLIVPVLAAAVGVASLTLVSNTAILPHANHRLTAVLAGKSSSFRSDREMTISELQAAARNARADADPQALEIAATYEVEIQKKYALAAACVVLAVAGVAIALRVPPGRRGGAGLVIGASGAVFGVYYALIMTGEDLAQRLVVSPFVGMWGANTFLLAAALLALWVRRAPRIPRERGTVAVHG